LDSIPDIREDKVAQLKEQIENGTYEIDEEKIADNMLKDSLLNDLT
jgi:negative regulator of flagellin synthesis FlgM